MLSFEFTPKFVLFVAGFPGAGKTTFCNYVADVFDAVLLSSDAVREMMFGAEEDRDHIIQNSPARFYDDVHSALFYSARQVLSIESSVVLDAQLGRYEDRRTIRRIAAEAGALPIFVWIDIDESLAKRRAISRPKREGTRRFTRAEIDRAFEFVRVRADLPRTDERVLRIDGGAPIEEQFSRFCAIFELMLVSDTIDA